MVTRDTFQEKYDSGFVIVDKQIEIGDEFVEQYSTYHGEGNGQILAERVCYGNEIRKISRQSDLERMPYRFVVVKRE